MYRNRQLTLDGVFGYNQLLVNGVDVAPTINTNIKDISYIYNQALISASQGSLNNAQILESLGSLSQTNTQDIKLIKSSLNEHIDNVKNNYIQQGQDIKFNTNIAKISFPSTFPTTATKNNETGIGWYWNMSGYLGETNLICYGQSGSGGLTLYATGTYLSPLLFCRLLPHLIDFSTTPIFPTNTTVGNIAATTKYVDDRLKETTGSISLFSTDKTPSSNINTTSANTIGYQVSQTFSFTSTSVFDGVSIKLINSNSTSTITKIGTFTLTPRGSVWMIQLMFTPGPGLRSVANRFANVFIQVLDSGKQMTLFSKYNTFDFFNRMEEHFTFVVFVRYQDGIININANTTSNATSSETFYFSQIRYIATRIS